MERARGVNAPRVSVVVPAYHSESTLTRCLQTLDAQTFRDFEVIVVDSSAADRLENVRAAFPRHTFIRSEKRLLPQAARNLGVRRARGALLVFTDPDIYLDAHWLEVLVASWDEHRRVTVGSFDCHGERWLDWGIHFCKFSKWLAAGSARAVDMSPSGNMLVSRDVFMRAGEFRGELFVGDVELSRVLRAQGETVWFEPRARGAHHHQQTFNAFCRERYERGAMYGALRSGWYAQRPFRLFALLIASVLPLRLFSNVAHVALHAWRAKRTGRFVATAPLVIIGYAATIAGEVSAFARALTGRGERSVAPVASSR